MQKQNTFHPKNCQIKSKLIQLNTLVKSPIVRSSLNYYKSGKLTKDKINKCGYNKFLTISKDVEVAINMDKVAEDVAWDGLKGYITNTKLSGEEVVSLYHGLWVVERAFRISKSNLEMRPIFHFTEKRIETHICYALLHIRYTENYKGYYPYTA